MVTKNQVELLKRIVHSTKENALSWADTADEDAFQTRIGKLVVKIEFIEYNNEYYIYIIREGKIIDTINLGELEFNAEFGGHQVKRDFETMYQDLKRKFSGADEAVEELLSNLPEPDIPF